MGIIPAVAPDVAATYAADVLAAPLPAALAALLVVLSAIGLRIVGAAHDAGGPTDGPMSWLRRRLLERSSPRAVAAAMLPRLQQRLPLTCTPRPAEAPAVAAHGLVRGPPGLDSHPMRPDTGAGVLPR